MTNQPTYIYSDAECVLYWHKDYILEPCSKEKYNPKGGWDYHTYVQKVNKRNEQAKSTAVKFKDQDYAGGVIALKYGTIKPNTIYTVEGYRMETRKHCHAYSSCDCMDVCKNGIQATLKRIEPVVEKENDEHVVDAKMLNFVQGINGECTASFQFKTKLDMLKFINSRFEIRFLNPPKQ